MRWPLRWIGRYILHTNRGNLSSYMGIWTFVYTPWIFLVEIALASSAYDELDFFLLFIILTVTKVTVLCPLPFGHTRITLHMYGTHSRARWWRWRWWWRANTTKLFRDLIGVGGRKWNEWPSNIWSAVHVSMISSLESQTNRGVR